MDGRSSKELVRLWNFQTDHELLLRSLQEAYDATADESVCSELRKYGATDKLLKLTTSNDEEIVDMSAAVLANLCGRTAAGRTSKRFVYGDITLNIRELAFAEADLGWQTWSSGQLLTQLISEGTIHVKGQELLEIGCGTGLPSLLACKLGAKKIIMTDFFPAVLENAKYNSEKNGGGDTIEVHSLDWNDWPTAQLSIGRRFPLVIGADLVYDEVHAMQVPEVIAAFLDKDPSSRAYVVLPGPTFRSGISTFEQRLEGVGFSVEKKEFREGEVVQHSLYVLCWKQNQ